MVNESVPIEISPADTKNLVDENECVLIDCREPGEYETAKIDGAKLLPMSEWDQAIEQLPQWEGRRLVVHCHHGVRSLRVVNWLRENGFPDAQSMAGGIAAWSDEIDSSVPHY